MDRPEHARQLREEALGQSKPVQSTDSSGHMAVRGNEEARPGRTADALAGGVFSKPSGTNHGIDDRPEPAAMSMSIAERSRTDAPPAAHEFVPAVQVPGGP